MSGSLLAELSASAEAKIARVESLAERLETPCGDGRMVWRRWGAGPPLVLLHGGYGSWLHWIRNVVPLGEHFSVYAADLPGLGESDTPPNPRDPWSMGRIVADGIEALLPPGPFDLVGFSYGAVMSGVAARNLGTRVRSFTLVGAGGLGLTRGDGPPLQVWRNTMGEEQLAALHRRNLEILMLADPANVDDVALHMQVTNTARAVVKSRYISRGTTLRDLLPELQTRLQGIWGERDSTTYPHTKERVDLLRSIQPDAPFRVIPGAGHWVMYEATDAFNAALLELLQRS